MKRISKIILLLLSSYLLPFTSAFAQQNYTTQSKKAIKAYEEGLLFVNGRKPDQAKASFARAVAADDNFIEAHLALGYLYGDLQQLPKAIEELKKAISINPGLFPSVYFSLARYQMASGMYQDARKNFDVFLDTKPENADLRKSARQNIVNCEFAIDAMQHPVPFNPVNAGAGLNSKYDEYFPCVTADEQLFLFTRKLPKPNTPEGFQEDFYISNKIDGKWNTAYSIGPKINTETNEGAPSLSADGNLLFFVVAEGYPDNPDEHDYGLGRKGYGSCDIFYSIREGNDWSKPKNAGPHVNTSHWETQPSFSSDGKTLYFIRGIIRAHTIQNPDIYMSVIGANGQFGPAKRVSDKINTPGDEESVFIHPDNQTLYFSSNGHPGMGGMDIYMSRRQPNGEWGEPMNLGYPINTFNDENSLLVSRDGNIAYFASDRAGGMGGLDIYSFDLPDAVKPGKTIYVKGKVFDAKTKLPLEAAIEVVDLQAGTNVLNTVSKKSNGEFLICLPVNKNYAFNASASGYLFNSQNFALNENKEYKPFDVSIPLSPIMVEGDGVKLNNVFFETAKYDLKEESKYELNKLADFLSKNPTVKIELDGHTDNVGDKKANQLLSQNRAKAVCDYLIANGIVKERLTYKGFGDTVPVVPNDSDEHRQMNRRTEFKIIAK